MINCIARDVINKFQVNKFVETGIMEGDTFITVVDWFSNLYKRDFITEKEKHGECEKTRYNIYEIDINPETMHVINRIRQKNKNVIPLCGNSPDMLKSLIDAGEFQPSDSCFFYLDAHTAGVSEPLAQELEQVKRLNFPFIVAIDDWASTSTGYPDMYGINHIRHHINDRVEVIWETAIPNIHSKQSCFIFFGYDKEHVRGLLQGLPLNEVAI